MNRQETVFDFSHFISNARRHTVLAAVLVLIGTGANAANVVPRGGGNSTATRQAPRANKAESRMPTLNTRAQSLSSGTPQEQETQPAPAAEPTVTDTPAPAPEPEPEPVIIENKSSQFADSLNATVTASARDTNASQLADMVRRQRAALDSQSASDAATNAANASIASGQSACDIGLRECMKEKCGSDYSKCAGDGDTIWGDKMDSCRRNVNCTGHQYTMFAAEIKADRDMNVKLSAYNKIIDCGNSYNDCIVTQCGPTYSKCLGKTAGDAAISKCATIAKNCTQQDSGLASRTMSVFATLRQDAEKTIVADEKRLYEMRDKMRSQCQRLGAMFDERSLVCVFTVNFFAGNSSTPTASKKAYAGGAFDCTPDWFGIDVTTFKENAYRYTRSQTSASSALMGAGLGIGVGALTSGAIDRAIDRKKAEDAVKKAEAEHEANYGDKTRNKTDNTSEPDVPASSDNTPDSDESTNSVPSATTADIKALEEFITERGGTVNGTMTENLPSINLPDIEKIKTKCTDSQKPTLTYSTNNDTVLKVICGGKQYTLVVVNEINEVEVQNQ